MTMSGGSTRKPAGSRDLQQSSSLSVLVPGERIKTVATLPILLMHLPQHTAVKAEVLITRNRDFTHPLVNQLFDLPKESGLWRITIQAEAQFDALVLDTPYDWQVTLISKIPGRGQPPTVTGTLQRVAIAPEIQSQLNSSTPQERVTLYQSLELTYDACVELDQIRRSDPTDVWAQTTWVTWMGNLGWTQGAEVPIIG